MKLEELIRRFRVLADDAITNVKWQDEDITDWLNEAQAEAAVRARLLLDDYTPAVCEIAVTAGTDSYALHAKVYEISSAAFTPSSSTCAIPVYQISREKLDRDHPQWRSLPRANPCWLVQTDTRVRLAPMPSTDGVLRLEAYRLPLKLLANDMDKPEIHENHHIHLIQWALYRAFSVPDAEQIDPKRSQDGLDNFERYFGLRPDADLRRATRADEVQHNVSYFA